ncbi:hypothetical protein INH39_23670 [Massilia violaceinigra]|uniref:HEAT repeat domain-containing protein n=1 Tax=Massilia violaceinigra TaxID=2045208 RepID=A0ABY4A0Z3_9BURK|nr:hypothetical protein [Massilia violaceinigra]UOD28429.1 hypothetical protein INH39_23670 [Massilia violaceinigra]
MKLSREDFAVALRHGRGCVVMHLREHGMDGVEDLVLAACLEDQCIDSQYGDYRAPWIYSLFKDSPAYPRFVDAIVAAIPHSQGDTDGSQLRELASLMGRDGDLQATSALRDLVWTQPFSSKRIIGAADLSAVDGLAAVVEMARRLGRFILQNPHECVDALGCLAGYAIPVEAALAELKRVAASDREVAAYLAAEADFDAVIARYDYMREQRAAGEQKRGERFLRKNPVESILAAASCKSSDLYLFQQFGRWAGKEDLERVLERLRVENDTEACKKLLRVFSLATVTHVDERIWKLKSHSAPEVRDAAEGILFNLSDPRVRDMARQRVSDPAFSSKKAWELGLFELNFEPGDESLILSALERQTVDGEDAYDLCAYAMGICTSVRSPALAGVALWVYRTSPSAVSRCKAVKMLLEWDSLPAHIAAESRYDASEELRALFGATP